MLSDKTNILRHTGVITMCILVFMLMAEGTWTLRLYHSWTFIIVLILSTFLLLITATADLRHHRWSAAMSHGGFAIVLLGGMLGALAGQEVHMVVDNHASERVAYADNDQPVVLPFALQLQSFSIDCYENSQLPKQYTASLQITPSLTSPQQIVVKTTSVNHPLRYGGWWIYMHDYDHQHEDFCILKLVRDPWLWMVYLGMIWMLAGAFWQTINAWHSWKVIPATLALAALFTAASLARIELGTLVPALRSFWFFPHILVYMIAYALLAIALIISSLGVFVHREKTMVLAQQLLHTASALLLIGMIFGAIWAKEAWGQYWTWDGKECWAAATWLSSVAGTHLNVRKHHDLKTLGVIVLTFCLMQVTWYGVNYLPSAKHSLHTYTTA